MAVSELPGNPNAVWTVKKNVDGEIPNVCLVYYWLCVVISMNILLVENTYPVFVFQ